MEKNCSSWSFHPSLVKATAGFIVLIAGLSKVIGGEAMFTGVGGMVLGIFGVAQGEMASVAYALGMIAAIIEVVGGLIFIVGCSKTTKWAALGLSIVMLMALLAKLATFPYSEAPSTWELISALVSQVRIDILLLAVFVSKAMHLVKGCGGCCSGQACAMPAQK